MKIPCCPLCDYLPDIDKEGWDKFLILHITNVHEWSLQDADDYVGGRPYQDSDD